MLLDQPESWQLAWTAYIHGSVTQPRFDAEVRARLRERIPPIDQAPAGAAAIEAPQPPPGQHLARPEQGMTGWVPSEPTR